MVLCCEPIHDTGFFFLLALMLPHKSALFPSMEAAVAHTAKRLRAQLANLMRKNPHMLGQSSRRPDTLAL